MATHFIPYLSPSLQLTGTAGAFRASTVLWRHPYRPDYRLFDHRVTKGAKIGREFANGETKRGKMSKMVLFSPICYFFPFLFPEALI
jgi:hypothetical protein